MNANVSLERMVTTWMADEASGGAPAALLDETLSVTGRLRPEPRWLALLKEPEMRTQSRVLVGIPSRGLVIAAVLAALLGLVLVAALVGSNLLRNPQLVTADDWPMFRGDATRAGLAARGPVGHPLPRWTFRAPAPVTKNISIVGELVYAPSDDGVIHAVGLTDGHERWTARLDKGPAAGPTLVDGVLYTSDANGVVYALDPSGGAVRWRSTITLRAPLQLTAAGGSLFVGTADGMVAALDPKTGAERWRTAVAPSGGVNAPALDGSSVYAGTARGGFVALDAATGALRWRVDTGSEETGTAVVANGVAYIGASADARTGHLRAIDVATGQVRWTIDGLFSSPTVSGGRLYTGGFGNVAALEEATGRLLWQAAVRGTVRAPAIAGGVIYVPVDGEQRIYALDAATGGELWHYDLDSSNLCCIAAAKGLVFAGTNRGTVYAIGGDGASLSPAPIVAAASASTAPSTSIPSSAAPSASAGPEPVKLIWKSASPPDGINPNGLVFDGAGRLWAADPYHDRFAIFTTDGKFVEYWGKSGSGKGEFNLRRSNGDGYGAIAFGPDGSAYVLDVGNWRVQKFDRDRRFVRAWGKSGDSPGEYSDPIGIRVGPDGTVYVLDDVRGVVEEYDANGEILQTVDTFTNTSARFNAANSLALDKTGNLYVSQIEPNQVAKFDPDGNLLQVFGAEGPGAFTEQPGWMATDDAGRLFVSQGSFRQGPGVEAFAPDGSYLGGFGARGSADGQISFPSGVLLDGAGNVYVGDAGDLEGSQTGGRIQKFKLLPPLGG